MTVATVPATIPAATTTPATPNAAAASATPAVVAAPPAVVPAPVPVTPAPAAAAPATPAPVTPPAPAAQEPAKVAPWDAPVPDPKAPVAAPAVPGTVPPQAAPEAMTLKAPEGSKMESAALEKFAQDTKALGITDPVIAQKLLDRDYARHQASLSVSRVQQDKWLTELQTTHGDKFPEVAENVRRGLQDFDPQGKIHQFLKDAGLTTHPMIVDAFARQGQRLREDKLFVPNAGKTDPRQNMTAEQKLADSYRQTMPGRKPPPPQRR